MFRCSEKKIVALLCTRGLPASYGAFEQTVLKIVEHSWAVDANIYYLVGTDSALKSSDYSHPNVKRIYAKRTSGFGVIIFGLITTFLSYLQGARTMVFFGYGLAPVFPVLSLLGVNVICNVDGFEWRRKKWGLIAKRYFKICEKITATSNIKIVADAKTIQKYYKVKHRKSSTLIRYGGDLFAPESQKSLEDYFVVVMRMEPENNIKMIVDAFIESNSNSKLYLIGPTTQYFQQLVQPQIEKDHRVNYLGSIYNRQKLFAIRQGAKGYIHGHSVGGTNPTLVEACLIGKPVIAYKTNFNKEVLNEKAQYFDSQSALCQIINNWRPDSVIMPPVLGEDYDWDVIVNDYLELMRNG